MKERTRVLLGTCIGLMGLAIGNCSSLFLDPVRKAFKVQEATATFVANSNFAIWALASLVSYKPMEKLGPRALFLSGGVLTCIGLVGASFSHNIESFAFWFGLVLGTGCAFQYLPCVSIQPAWFSQTSLALAYGISLSGLSVGSIAWALSTDRWMAQLGWRRMMHIGTILNLVFTLSAAALFPSTSKPSSHQKPLLPSSSSSQKGQEEIKEMKVFETTTSPARLDVAVEPPSLAGLEPLEPLEPQGPPRPALWHDEGREGRQGQETREGREGREGREWHVLKTLDPVQARESLGALKDALRDLDALEAQEAQAKEKNKGQGGFCGKPFLMFSAALFVDAFAWNAPLFSLVSDAEHKGFAHSPRFLSVYTVGSLFGRLFCGFAVRAGGPFATLLGCFLGASACCVVWALAKTAAELYVVAGFFGAFNGALVVAVSASMPLLLSPDTIAKGFSITWGLTWFTGTFSTGYILGSSYDKHGSYEIALWVYAAACLAAASLILVQFRSPMQPVNIVQVSS